VEQPIRLKRGAVREDGKIFYAYRSCKRNSTAIWLSPESYKRVIDRDRFYKIIKKSKTVCRLKKEITKANLFQRLDCILPM